jgi:predicted unusual protein kinase regulating ubiquinone biosynthesis (AarF/ABC1/UbiB family)
MATLRGIGRRPQGLVAADATRASTSSGSAAVPEGPAARTPAPPQPGRLRPGDLLRAVTVVWVLALRVGRRAGLPCLDAVVRLLRRRLRRTVGSRPSATAPVVDAGAGAPPAAWWAAAAAAAAEGLVDGFIALGPTFVKIGQLMASAPGVFPAPLARAGERCLDAVPPFPVDQVRQTIEEDLGRPVGEVFSSFEDVPLASASIGQVHGCVLSDGRQAVVKVQRPGIAGRMLADLRIAAVLAAVAERSEAGRRLNLRGMVRDLYQVTVGELDFVLEAAHQQAFRANIGAFGDNRWVTAPEVYPELCGPRVICMERLFGVPVDDFDVLEARQVDGELLMRRGLKVGLEAVCVHGPFQADTHAGNIWVLDDGRVAFLDFGITGVLEPPWRQMVRDLLRTFMIDGDWARVVRHYKDLGVLQEELGTDEELGAVLAAASEPVLDAGAEAVDLADLFGTQLDLARQLGARLPQELMLVAKQLFYFERYMKILAPEYRLARDLFLIKNIWPAEAAQRAAELGIGFPE